MRVYFVLIHAHKYNFICGVYSFVPIKTHTNIKEKLLAVKAYVMLTPTSDSSFRLKIDMNSLSFIVYLHVQYN
jgi:hypothetical protein